MFVDVFKSAVAIASGLVLDKMSVAMCEAVYMAPSNAAERTAVTLQHGHAGLHMPFMAFNVLLHIPLIIPARLVLFTR